MSTAQEHIQQPYSAAQLISKCVGLAADGRCAKVQIGHPTVRLPEIRGSHAIRPWDTFCMHQALQIESGPSGRSRDRRLPWRPDLRSPKAESYVTPLQVVSAIVARRSGSLKGLPQSAGSPSEASMEAASLIAGRLDEMGARMADRADVIAIEARLQVSTLTAPSWSEPGVVASWRRCRCTGFSSSEQQMVFAPVCMHATPIRQV